MIDRETLLALAAAGMFVVAPSARAWGAGPAGVTTTVAALTTTSAAPEEDDEKKGPEKGDKKHEEKDEKEEKGEDGEKGEHKEKKKEIETDVPIAMVPPAVVDAVMKECPGGKITESELEAKHDKIMYGFDVKVGEMTYDVNISVDGKFISKKVDDDGDNEKDEKKPAAAGEKH